MDKEKSLFQGHWAETLVSIVVFFGTGIAQAMGGIPASTTIIINVITLTLSISVAIVKDHFSSETEALRYRNHLIGCKTAEVSSILEGLGGTDLEHALEIVDSSLDSLRLIPQGIVRLDPSKYYSALSRRLHDMKKGAHVFAVSSMPIERWDSDPRQLHYLQENFAASDRGVFINRVFIIDRHNAEETYASRARHIVAQQRTEDIEVFVVWRDTIRHDPTLFDDFVLFEEANIVFTDEHEKVDPTRVAAGYQVTNPKKVDSYRTSVKSLIETYSIDQTSLDNFLATPFKGTNNGTD